MRSLSDEDETVAADVQKSARPSWMRTAQSTCESLLQLLPTSFEISLEGMAKGDPLVRFFRREVALGSKLLRQLQQDLHILLACCKGETQQTNHIRELIDAITKGS
jgi:dynein heavy chain 1